MRYTEFGLTGGFSPDDRTGTIAAARSALSARRRRCRVTDEADLGVDCMAAVRSPSIRCALSAQVAVQSVAEYSDLSN